MISRILRWLRQPTTIGGIATACAAISAVLIHQATWVQATPIYVGCAVSILLPDNSAARADARAFTAALLQHLNSENGPRS